MKIKLIVITFFFLLFACNKSKRINVVLKKDYFHDEVIYLTERANFHFDKSKLIAYCKLEDNGESNDFAFRDVIKYVEDYPSEPIIIPDTLGTKIVMESEIYSNRTDSLIRVRDQEHPFAWVTEEIDWAVVKFAKSGDIRVFDKYSNTYSDTIIYAIVETNSYGATNIHLKNDTMIFSTLRWIR